MKNAEILDNKPKAINLSLPNHADVKLVHEKIKNVLGTEKWDYQPTHFSKTFLHTY